MRTREPRPWSFIITGVLLGAAAFGLTSLLGDQVPGFSEVAAMGYMLVAGAAVGGIIGLVVAALVAGKPEKKAPRPAGATPSDPDA
ncbi:hypothetical protein [Kribbia dieselivorans]|uniref:hypothetical protein n=1 Tax=Kribbia dieselivorans TaxID=331526 RepID=UPI000838A273|nr:hypothetical protein [Kribbia dieselivorans]